MGQCSSEKSIVPVLHLQIGLGNDVLRNLLGFVDSDVGKLSTGEEGDYNTLVSLNQVINKRRQYHQICDVNDGVMFQRKAMHLKRLHAMKASIHVHTKDRKSVVCT